MVSPAMQNADPATAWDEGAMGGEEGPGRSFWAIEIFFFAILCRCPARRPSGVTRAKNFWRKRHKDNILVQGRVVPEKKKDKSILLGGSLVAQVFYTVFPFFPEGQTGKGEKLNFCLFPPLVQLSRPSARPAFVQFLLGRARQKEGRCFQLTPLYFQAASGVGAGCHFCCRHG